MDYFACFYNRNMESLPSNPVSLDEEATSAYVSQADTEPELSTMVSTHCSAPEVIVMVLVKVQHRLII